MKKLILDANAFIKDVDFNVLAQKHEFYTLPSVLSEVRDERARQRLASLLHPIQYVTPSQEANRLVRNFATLTGDLASLSEVDLDILALAYELVVKCGQKSLINTTPPKPLEFNAVKNIIYERKQKQAIAQENAEKDRPDHPKGELRQEPKEAAQEPAQETLQEAAQQPKPAAQIVEEPKVDQEQGHESPEAADQQEKQGDPNEPQEEEEDDDGWISVERKGPSRPKRRDGDSSDDEEGWINIDNLEQMKNDCQIAEEELDKLNVAVVTTDYAMQNVLLQMGIPIVSTEGYRIKSARRFILECHVCKMLERDPTKLFCQKCCNHSLLKVSCSLNADGTIYLYRKRNFQLNMRGTQYDRPKQTSKKDPPFIFCQDQLLKQGIQQQLERQKKQDEYKYKKTLKNYENGVGFDEADFRKPKQKLVVGYGNLNPNDVNDMRKIKRMQKR